MPRVQHEISYHVDFDGNGSLQLVIVRNSSSVMSKSDAEFVKSLEEAVSSYMTNKSQKSVTTT